MAEPGISIRAYARHRGVSHTAVEQRIREGSLPNGARQIEGRWRIDPELADTEWHAKTRPYAKSSGPKAPSALAEATLRERRARAWLIELDIARRTRDLVSAREVEQVWAREVVEVRTALLALPTKARQRIAHLTTADLLILDALVRELLEGLAARAWRDGDDPQEAASG